MTKRRGVPRTYTVAWSEDDFCRFEQGLTLEDSFFLWSKLMRLGKRPHWGIDQIFWRFSLSLPIENPRQFFHASIG